MFLEKFPYRVKFYTKWILKTVQAGKMVFSHAKRGFEKVTALFQSPLPDGLF